MSLLETEISKLKKKGYEIAKTKTLKYGKTVYLEKKISGVKGFLIKSCDRIYLYFAEGESNIRNMTEFLNEYRKFYNDNEFDSSDKGYFLVSGTFDKSDFNKLRNGLYKSDELKNSIVVRQVESEVIKQKSEFQQEKIKEKIVEREITRTNITTEKVSFSKVVRTIESIDFIACEKEKDYENQLYQFLGAKGFEVCHEKSRKGARFDLVIGDDEIAVELKIIKGSSEFQRLLGQIMQYKSQFNNIIIVLVDKFGNPSVMKQETKRIKEIDPENIAIVIK